MHTSAIAAIAIALVLPQAGSADVNGDRDRILTKEVVVDAPLAAVWDAWTTEEGIKFVSAKSRIELKVGGPYELFVDGPVEKDGRRGAEGSRVLAFLPSRMLAFEWTFPPAIMALREVDARTQVVVLFDSIGPGQTRVQLHVLGWQVGPDWDAGYAYFDRAWTFVLNTLQEHFASKPPESMAQGKRQGLAKDHGRST